MTWGKPMNPASVLFPEAPTIVVVVEPPRRNIGRINPPTPPPPRKPRKPREERAVIILNPEKKEPAEMAEHTLTVICRDTSNHGYENVLIYTVTVPDLDAETVAHAVVAERQKDLGEGDEPEIELLFAFAGDLPTAKDWRE